MGATLLPKAIILTREARRGYLYPLSTDQGPKGHSQFDCHGAYCGLITASEVFFLFLLPNKTSFLVFFSLCTI